MTHGMILGIIVHGDGDGTVHITAIGDFTILGIIQAGDGVGITHGITADGTVAADGTDTIITTTITIHAHTIAVRDVREAIITDRDIHRLADVMQLADEDNHR